MIVAKPDIGRASLQSLERIVGLRMYRAIESCVSDAGLRGRGCKAIERRSSGRGSSRYDDAPATALTRRIAGRIERLGYDLMPAHVQGLDALGSCRDA